MQISNTNLNLIKALEALLEERHVTRASQRLHVTQAAMSSSLAKLRELYQDPLLIRTKNEMLLSEKAQALLPEVKTLMQQISDFLNHDQQFDPKNSKRKFTLGMSDYSEIVLLPKLIKIVRKQAPNISFTVLDRTYLEKLTELESGQIDLMVGHYKNPPSTIMQKKLFDDGLACVVNKKHPLANKKLNAENFFTYAHLVIGYNDKYGQSNTQLHLKSLGYSFTPQLILQHVGAASLIAAQTESVFICTKRLADVLVTQLPLVKLDYPFPDIPKPVAFYWHRRFNDDPAHQWLRKIISDLR